MVYPVDRYPDYKWPVYGCTHEHRLAIDAALILGMTVEFDEADYPKEFTLRMQVGETVWERTAHKLEFNRGFVEDFRCSIWTKVVYELKQAAAKAQFELNRYTYMLARETKKDAAAVRKMVDPMGFGIWWDK